MVGQMWSLWSSPGDNEYNWPMLRGLGAEPDGCGSGANHKRCQQAKLNMT